MTEEARPRRRLIGGASALAAIALLAGTAPHGESAPMPRQRKPKLRAVPRAYAPAESYRKTTTHAQRAALCAERGVQNTGRQWRKLRKRLGLTTHMLTKTAPPAHVARAEELQ